MLPSASSAPLPQRVDEQRRRGRRVALVIFAFCAVPAVAAWFAYFVWQPKSRTNYGELIEPRLLSDPLLSGLDGRPFRLSQLHGKWVLLQIDSGKCDELCRKKLVYMRQARLAQGKNAERVERLWLIDDSAVPDSSLLHDHPGLRVARAPRGAFALELPAAESAAAHIYVVDPRGNLMLRFPRDADARGMLRDLSRLLAVSRVG